MACSGKDEGSSCQWGAGAAPGVTGDPYRPLYHFTPLSGWMNDPAGLVYHAGEWHLFYQHNPHRAVWSNIHWGHAVSADLVRWEHLPTALQPHPVLGMVFTGSAVKDRHNTSGFCKHKEGCLVALFTHAMGQDGAQKQSLAYSNDRGRTWTLYDKNPVIPNPGIKDFRDPRVFWHTQDAQWKMVLAAGDRAKLYSSSDLRRWTGISDFGPLSGFPGGAWECPDLFPLPIKGGAEKWVLKVDVSPGIGQAGHSRYLVGRFDGARFINEGPKTGLPLDSGADFYAAQTFSDAPGGRRVWIAWQNNWLYALNTPTGAWRGAISIPRELSLAQEGSSVFLLQQPVKELANLRTACSFRLDQPRPIGEANKLLEEVLGDALEVILELAPGAGGDAGLSVLQGPGGETRVGYDRAKGVVYLDRRQSGDVSFHKGFAARHEAALPLSAGSMRLHIFVDRSSVEVFGGGGRVVLTDTIYPAPGSTGLSLYSNGGGSATVRALEVFELR